MIEMFCEEISLQDVSDIKQHCLSCGSGTGTDLSSLPITSLSMTDYFVIIRNGASFKAPVEDLRCKIINDYIVTNYPSDTVFVGDCPVFVNDILVRI
jgi:hypothetical protein